MSKKGWTDLSGIFGKSVNLYEDPNESSQTNGLSSSNSYTDYSSGLSAGGYQQEVSSRQTQDEAFSRHKTQQQSRIKETPAQAASETNFLLSSSGTSVHSPSASPSSSKSKGKNGRKAGDVPQSVPAVSREEKTLLDLESEFNPSKSSKGKSKPKTIEDEFWADLEK